MKTHWLLAAGTLQLLFLLAGEAVFAEIRLHDNVTIDLEMRYRMEVMNKSFDLEQGALEYSLLRTRLGMNFTPVDKVFLRVNIGDSRALGTNYPNKQHTQTNDFHLHEGYMLLSDFFIHDLSLQLGRFQMMYGRLRFLGHGNWSNYGWRSYDGARFIYHLGGADVDLFYVKLQDRAFADFPNTGDPVDPSERSMYGLYGHAFGNTVQPFFIVDCDQRAIGQSTPTVLYNPGLYLDAGSGDWDIEADAIYQAGETEGVDKSAYLLAMDAAYRFGGAWKPRAGLGVDMISGDNDPNDDTDHSFYADFYSKHRYQGFCDFFRSQSARDAGLIDLILRLEASPLSGWRINLDLHRFQRPVEMTNIAGETYTFLGYEADLRIRTKLYGAVDMDMALCGFQPSEDWKQSRDPAWFTYLALTASF